QLAMWESGMDDSPLWDDATYDEESWTMRLNALDLNCLYALDSRCLALMAEELDLPQEAAHYRQEYERLKELINSKMWDAETGFYYDQYWDGTLSGAKAASSFYPLLAGVASPQQADRMLKHLLNEDEFWGDYILPTISRDHPSFNDQQYWRGTIWPPTNYLVYQGLKHYRYDQIAAQYAERSVQLFIRSWLDYQLCRENYDSRTGEGGGRRYQSWGPLFCLVGIEEFIDYEPWGGLRFGSSGISQSSKISNVPLDNHLYDVTIGPQLTEVFRDGKLLFRADRDVVVRNFISEEGMAKFHINARTATRIQLPFAPEGKEVKIEKDGAYLTNQKITGGFISLEIPAGKSEYRFILQDK
ncbi:MAG: amylo-alpha-1,6-glucosidase, partial [Acidobacteriota bacterium]